MAARHAEAAVPLIKGREYCLIIYVMLIIKGPRPALLPSDDVGTAESG